MDIVEIIQNSPDAIIGKGTTIEEIELAEQELDLSFSQEYISYLEKIGQALFEGHELTGIGVADYLDVVKITKDENTNNPNTIGLYVIEKTNFDLVVIWQDSTGIVYETIGASIPRPINTSIAEYLNQN